MMTNETLSVIASRRSRRAYQRVQITPEQLDALLTAAKESPSAMNRQPWHFTVVQNETLLNEINDAARQGVLARVQSQRSARFEDEEFNVFYHAPTVVFLSADPDNYWAKIDCGIAVENIALAAESMGLGSVILGLPREAFLSSHGTRLREMLGFPAGYDFVIAIAVGFATDDKEPHPQMENRVTIIE